MTEPKYVKMWSMAQRPEQPGTVVPVGILAQATKLVDLHKGMRAYEVISPSNSIHYVEYASGGVLGTDLNMINLMIDETPDMTLIYQIKMNIETSKRVIEVDPLEFWYLLEQGE